MKSTDDQLRVCVYRSPIARLFWGGWFVLLALPAIGLVKLGWVVPLAVASVTLVTVLMAWIGRGQPVLQLLADRNHIEWVFRGAEPVFVEYDELKKVQCGNWMATGVEKLHLIFRGGAVVTLDRQAMAPSDFERLCSFLHATFPGDFADTRNPERNRGPLVS